MNEIMDILVEIVKIILASTVAFVGWKIKAFVQAKIGEKETNELYSAINKFVKAAEQTYKEVDATGEIRFDYVAGLVRELGYEVTEEITAYIESAVFELNSKKGDAK